MIANDSKLAENSHYPIANHSIPTNRKLAKRKLFPIIESVEEVIAKRTLKDTDYITLYTELKNLQSWLLT